MHLKKKKENTRVYTQMYFGIHRRYGVNRLRRSAENVWTLFTD